MSEIDLFRKFGGIPDLGNIRMGGLPANALMGNNNEPVINFGLSPPSRELMANIEAKQGLYDRFPNLRGKWDGKTTVNHWQSAAKVLGVNGAEELIHYQPRGTCGGRAGSLAGDLLQCVMIANGKLKLDQFRRVSHAWLYRTARAMYGMDKGDPNNERSDGVAAGSIPEVLVKFGACTREETGDVKWYGPGSDDLACRWGAGKIDPAQASGFTDSAGDNLFLDWAPIYSAAEMADAIAGGGIVIGSDMQGFTMMRDKQGFCSPKGQWAHYHVRSAVRNVNGRKGFDYSQSWGKDTPTGPRVEGCPGNVFLVDWDVMDRLAGVGQYAAIFGFAPFVESGENDEPEMDWIVSN